MYELNDNILYYFHINAFMNGFNKTVVLLQYVSGTYFNKEFINEIYGSLNILPYSMCTTHTYKHVMFVPTEKQPLVDQTVTL